MVYIKSIILVHVMAILLSTGVRGAENTPLDINFAGEENPTKAPCLMTALSQETAPFAEQRARSTPEEEEERMLTQGKSYLKSDDVEKIDEWYLKVTTFSTPSPLFIHTSAAIALINASLSDKTEQINALQAYLEKTNILAYQFIACLCAIMRADDALSHESLLVALQTKIYNSASSLDDFHAQADELVDCICLLFPIIEFRIDRTRKKPAKLSTLVRSFLRDDCQTLKIWITLLTSSERSLENVFLLNALHEWIALAEAKNVFLNWTSVKKPHYLSQSMKTFRQTHPEKTREFSCLINDAKQTEIQPFLEAESMKKETPPLPSLKDIELMDQEQKTTPSKPQSKKKKKRPKALSKDSEKVLSKDSENARLRADRLAQNPETIAENTPLLIVKQAIAEALWFATTEVKEKELSSQEDTLSTILSASAHLSLVQKQEVLIYMKQLEEDYRSHYVDQEKFTISPDFLKKFMGEEYASIMSIQDMDSPAPKDNNDTEAK